MAVIPNVHYRVYVMNDFTERYGFIEYHAYGQGHLKVFNCSTSAGQHRGFSRPDDRIFVFLNYVLQGKFKAKQEARPLLAKLLAGCPPDVRSDFERFGGEILQLVD